MVSICMYMYMNIDIISTVHLFIERFFSKCLWYVVTACVLCARHQGADSHAQVVLKQPFPHWMVCWRLRGRRISQEVPGRLQFSDFERQRWPIGSFC